MVELWNLKKILYIIIIQLLANLVVKKGIVKISLVTKRRTALFGAAMDAYFAKIHQTRCININVFERPGNYIITHRYVDQGPMRMEQTQLPQKYSGNGFGNVGGAASARTSVPFAGWASPQQPRPPSGNPSTFQYPVAAEGSQKMLPGQLSSSIAERRQQPPLPMLNIPSPSPTPPPPIPRRNNNNNCGMIREYLMGRKFRSFR